MSENIQQAIEKGKQACIEHGFGFIGIYQTRSEANVQDGWDRFIISPVHVSENEYQYIGYVRVSGEFVGRLLTKRAADGATPCAHDFAVTDDVFDYCIHCDDQRPAANASRSTALERRVKWSAKYF